MDPHAATTGHPGMIRTCPMRSEGQQDRPGNCPICGVMLEPSIPLDAENNHEFKDFQRDFWWTLTLTVIVTALAMSLSSASVIFNALRLRRA